jgi:hypothetical protein
VKDFFGWKYRPEKTIKNSIRFNENWNVTERFFFFFDGIIGPRKQSKDSIRFSENK